MNFDIARGIALLLMILFGYRLVRIYMEADKKQRPKLMKIYIGLAAISIMIVIGTTVFHLPDKLFIEPYKIQNNLPPEQQELLEPLIEGMR